jgi:ATP-binding cassette subfamily B protein RaxB
MPFEQSYMPEHADAASGIQWIGQRESSDCGVASLAMVCAHYRLPTGIEEIRARTQVGSDGATLGELVRVAQSLNLHAHAARVAPSQWSHVHTPAIVHQANGHYVVLFRLDLEGVIVGDPATGIVKISVLHFAQMATGHVLLFRLDRV